MGSHDNTSSPIGCSNVNDQLVRYGTETRSLAGHNGLSLCAQVGERCYYSCAVRYNPDDARVKAMVGQAHGGLFCAPGRICFRTPPGL